MAADEGERKLAAILAADVVSYSRLMPLVVRGLWTNERHPDEPTSSRLVAAVLASLCRL